MKQALISLLRRLGFHLHHWGIEARGHLTSEFDVLGTTFWLTQHYRVRKCSLCGEWDYWFQTAFDPQVREHLDTIHPGARTAFEGAFEGTGICAWRLHNFDQHTPPG